jgi:ferric-dicitrate binding protein FerR (iron transport regulator)
MTRLDELTLKLADGLISDEELGELERLLEEHPEAIASQAELLELVARLRGEAPPPDIVEKTLGRIQERISERIKIGVLGQIRSRKLERKPGRRALRRAASERRSPPRPWSLVLVVSTLAAAVLVVFLVLGQRESDRPSPDESRLPEAPQDRRGIPQPGPDRSKTDPNPVPPGKEEPRSIPRPFAPGGNPPKIDPALETRPINPPRVEPPSPLPPAEPSPEPPRTLPPAPTVVVAAILEKGEDASVLAGGVRAPAKPGREILEGEGIDTKTAATIRWPDGTRFELLPKTILAELSVKNGKRITVTSGILVAQVAEQPLDRPMVLATPQAEVRVLGTVFRLSVDPASDGTTHVEVTEGKVRVKRAVDGKSIDVARGNGVTVAKSASALSAQPHTGLVAHWKLDEASGMTALDSSGNLNHGTLHGETSWVSGRLGGALRIGPGGSISIQGFQPPEAFTVSFWVYMAKLNADQDWFVNFGGSSFVLMREGNMERRQVRTGFDGTPQEFLTVASALQAGQWTHLAATYDGSEIRLFSNGGASGMRKGTRHVPPGDLTLGHMSPGSEAIFDDIRIYDRALAAPDIGRIMQGLPPLPPARR